jgi:succinyl-diaminopimelate desuccinylase
LELKELFIQLLKFKSITPNDDGAFDFIDNYLEDFEKISIDKNGVKNRFYYKKFGDGDHISFAGHIDVVPAGDGWSSEPFNPLIDGDYITARGTQDMKSGVAAFLDSLNSINNFNGTLSILLTSDEEGDAKYGTVEVLKHLKEIAFLPNYFIVAEPTSEKVFADAIKVGRRGSINGVLKLYGVQGHAAYPEKSTNPINLIAPILPKISNFELDSGDEFFAPSKFVITDIRAGLEVTNVTPGVLKMMFNVRNSTKTSKEDIKNFIDSHFKDLNYELELSQSAKPFVTNKESKVVKNIQKAIKSITNQDTKLSTAGGTSDARFIGEYGVDVIELGVINDRIHAPNERTSIKDVEALRDIFNYLIKNWN